MITISAYNGRWPQEFTQIEAYYDIKDPTYDLIWDAAQTWAKFTNRES
jgi:hypothetical protein